MYVLNFGFKLIVYNYNKNRFKQTIRENDGQMDGRMDGWVDGINEI